MSIVMVMVVFDATVQLLLLSMLMCHFSAHKVVLGLEYCTCQRFESRRGEVSYKDQKYVDECLPVGAEQCCEEGEKKP